MKLTIHQKDGHNFSHGCTEKAGSIYSSKTYNDGKDHQVKVFVSYIIAEDISVELEDQTIFISWENQLGEKERKQFPISDDHKNKEYTAFIQSGFLYVQTQKYLP